MLDSEDEEVVEGIIEATPVVAKLEKKFPGHWTRRGSKNNIPEE